MFNPNFLTSYAKCTICKILSERYTDCRYELNGHMLLIFTLGNRKKNQFCIWLTF